MVSSLNRFCTFGKYQLSNVSLSHLEKPRGNKLTRILHTSHYRNSEPESGTLNGYLTQVIL